MHVVQEYKAKQKMLEKSAEERDRIAQGGSPLKHPRKESVFVAKQVRMGEVEVAGKELFGGFTLCSTLVRKVRAKESTVSRS